MFLKVQAFRKHELFNLTSMALTMFFCFFFLSLFSFVWEQKAKLSYFKVLAINDSNEPLKFS